MIEYTEVSNLKQTYKKQKQTISDRDETIKLLKKQDLETRISYYELLIRLSNIGHSDDLNKNIKMTDLIDNTIKEIWEDLKIELFVENDEEGKIIELNAPEQCI